MSTIRPLSHFFLYLSLSLVLSQHVTFENVKVQYLTQFSEEFIVDINTTTFRKSLPSDEIYRITIIGGTIPVISSDAISDFPNLRILQIRQHGVEKIEPGALKNVPLLEIVRLNGNKIKQIEDGVFSNLNIVFLSLDHNLIEKISPHAFDALQKLEVLDLSYNKLMEVYPQWLRQKPVLVSVSFTYNEIEHLPDGVFESYHKGIDLSNNKIRNVSRSIFGSGDKNIGQLWLNDNGIVKWDESLLQNARVGVFDVSRNRLECLDGNFEHFFVATRSRIDGNPWNCECLKKIEKWVLEKEKNVQMKVSLKSCSSAQ